MSVFDRAISKLHAERAGLNRAKNLKQPYDGTRLVEVERQIDVLEGREQCMRELTAATVTMTERQFRVFMARVEAILIIGEAGESGSTGT